MKIKPQHVFALALMGAQGAWSAGRASASLDFFIRAWPLYPLYPYPSNTATVSLTITPVNDAPVAADVTVSTGS